MHQAVIIKHYLLQLLQEDISRIKELPQLKYVLFLKDQHDPIFREALNLHINLILILCIQSGFQLFLLILLLLRLSLN